MVLHFRSSRVYFIIGNSLAWGGVWPPGRRTVCLRGEGQGRSQAAPLASGGSRGEPGAASVRLQYRKCRMRRDSYILETER